MPYIHQIVHVRLIKQNKIYMSMNLCMKRLVKFPARVVVWDCVNKIVLNGYVSHNKIHKNT